MKKILAVIALVLIILITILPFVRDTEKMTLSPEIRATLSGSFVQLPQGVVHYQQAGPDTAQPVVLIHGFSVPYYIWDPTFAALAKDGFHVLRYDLFGRGYSDRPDAVYDRQFFEQQLLDLLNALEIKEPVDLVGVSMGGAITTGFAVDYPHKVRNVVLIDPFQEAFKIPGLDLPIIGEYLMTAFLAPSSPEMQMEDFYQPKRFPEWPSKYREQMKYYGFRRAILSTLRNFLNEDQLPIYQRLGQLGKRVLLIWGEEDKTLPFSNSDRLRKALNCNFFAVKQAGHIPQYERPEIVNPKLIHFLRE